MAKWPVCDEVTNNKGNGLPVLLLPLLMYLLL